MQLVEISYYYTIWQKHYQLPTTNYRNYKTKRWPSLFQLPRRKNASRGVAKSAEIALKAKLPHPDRFIEFFSPTFY